MRISHCFRLTRLLLALLTLWAGATTVTAAAPEEPPKRILFLFADDLGWGDLKSNGSDYGVTFQIDRLAQEGTTFTQFYTPASVCSPSRVGVMSGRFPGELGFHTVISGVKRNAELGILDFLDPELPMLPRLLKSAGYRTAHFGKWHLGTSQGMRAPLPDAYGIDEHRVTTGRGNTWENEDDPFFRSESSNLIVNETIRFLDQHRDERCFVNLWFLLTHATLNPTEEELEAFRSRMPVGTSHPGATAIYLASLRNLDVAVGRLLTWLDEQGMAEDTLVLFSSDNGPEDITIRNASHSGVGSAGPFRGRKRSLYEGGIRLPLLARWPGHIPAGEVNDSVVAGVDLLPTLCRFAGVELPDDMRLSGEDRSAVLLGAREARSKSLFWEWRYRIPGQVLNRSPILAMREGPWKLLMNPDGSRKELYRIGEDPMELQNLADRQTDVVESMSESLRQWYATLPEAPIDEDAGKAEWAWPK
ncbi:MAG: sulfatase-like hydrolase/transferase [Verrucomicrobiae bacterium]|nr:sulfatase-like hydrolase/transferase [Verrucomicrobiae bacterium]